MWLLARLAPDHTTIADFRKDNGPGIKRVCARFVEVCRKMGLAVVGAIEPNLRTAEFQRVRRKRPECLDAYELVLRGQPDVDSGMPGRAETALPLLMRDLALEPAYALAHGLAAMAHHNLYLRAGFKEDIASHPCVRPAWRWSMAAMMRWRSPSPASRSEWTLMIAQQLSPYSKPRSR